MMARCMLTGRHARSWVRRGSWCHRRDRGLGNESAHAHVRSRGHLVQIWSVLIRTAEMRVDMMSQVELHASVVVVQTASLVASGAQEAD